MHYLKHKDGKPTKKRESKQPAPENVSKVVVTGPDSGYSPSPSMQHDINHVDGLGDVATNLDWIGDAVARLTADGNHVGLAVCQNRYGGPIQITPTDEDGNGMMDRLVAAMERIADSVAKLAGLNRPRLESWHEQCEYEPRYKNIAVDDGAPGPKST
jgi:hypothetical protein